MAETELLDRLRAHDESAVADLAALYRTKIHQLAFRYTRNQEDAEEVAQDVLLKVSRKIDAFRGEAALSSWIYRITFNTVMSRLRARKGRVGGHEGPRLGGHGGPPLPRRRGTPLWVPDSSGPASENAVAPQPVADWSSLADDRIMRAELRRRLVDALKDLPAIYRVPVVLRDIQGLSTEEASAVLRVKEQTLKSRLHRGRTILRDRLSDFASGLTLHDRRN